MKIPDKATLELTVNNTVILNKLNLNRSHCETVNNSSTSEAEAAVVGKSSGIDLKWLAGHRACYFSAGLDAECPELIFMIYVL